MATFACFAAAMYLRELWAFFTDRAAYDQMRKPRISHGEDGDIPVGVADRLIFSYPLFIGISGAFAFWLGWQLLGEMS